MVRLAFGSLTMDTTFVPQVRYHPDGSSRRVISAKEDESLKQQGWGESPFPAPPEVPQRPSGIQGQLQDLHDRVLVLEAMLLKRKGGK